MNATECARESEIIDEIAAGRWPLEAPAALTAHAASCPVCADLALAASALHDDQAAAAQAPMALPSAGQVWWRAELRARHEAVRMAQRPMLAVQVVAAVVFLAALAAGVRSLAPEAWAWVTRTATVARTGIGTIDTVTLALVLSFGLSLLLAPIALYMVLRADRQGGR
jgi:predicted anti-sigma-YlaC factor YlaD